MQYTLIMEISGNFHSESKRKSNDNIDMKVNCVEKVHERRAILIFTPLHSDEE